MLSPEGIRRKAEQAFPKFLLYKLKSEVFPQPEECCPEAKQSETLHFFPWEIPAGREYRSLSLASYTKIEKSLAELHRFSKHITGTGYSLVRETAETRKMGTQTLLKKVVFATEEDYLSFLKKTKQAFRFLKNVRTVYGHYPASEPWICSSLDRLQNSEDSENYWEQVCSCVKWFLENPVSGLYIREIPLPIHTKFIESHKNDILSLVRFLRRGQADESTGFEDELGLRQDEAFIRFRIGDRDQGFPLSVFSREEILESYGEHYEIKEVFIIENKMVYLTFPKAEKRLCIFGSGFQVTALSSCAWLSSVPVFYFGDLDEHGFLILSRFRNCFSHVRSFCMDICTLENFDEFRVPGKSLPAEMTSGKVMPLLTEDEQRVFSSLRNDQQRNRLEQERIPLSYVIEQLKKISRQS